MSWHSPAGANPRHRVLSVIVARPAAPPLGHLPAWTRALGGWLFVLLAGVLPAADVREHGAKGDGVADDTAAITKAIAGGGAVRFPAGTYRLTRGVRIDLKSTGYLALVGDGAAVIRMEGAGPAFHFVGTQEKTASPADFPSEFWSTQMMPKLQGLTIAGKHPQAIGVQVTRVMQMTITECNFRQLQHGIHLTERNRNVLIGNCHVYDNLGVGIFLDKTDLHQINVGNSHISYNRGGGIVARGGAVRNLQVSGCDIEGNMHPDSPPTANILLDSTDGSIGEVEITGCSIQHFTRNHGGSANIRFIGHSTPVRFTPEQRHGQLVISGNMINDADINIHLDGVRSAVITGNTLHFGPRHDILIERSAHVVLSSNVFDRHPRYNYTDAIIQGIVIRDSTDCTIIGLHINGGRAPAAIAIHGGARFHIANCTIADVANLALLLENVSGSFVHGNMINVGDPGRAAIRVSGGKDNLVRDNHVIGRIE